MSLLQRNTRKQGDVGLGDAISFFTSRGHSVSIPLTESQRYDIVVDDGETLYRVEVKTSRNEARGKYNVELRTKGGYHKSGSGAVATPSIKDSDYVYVMTANHLRYLIPTAVIAGKQYLTLGPKYDEYLVV